VSVVPSDGVDRIVKRLKTVRILGGASDPGLVAELGEVAVLEETVQAVSKAGLVAGNLGCYQVVLADSVFVPAGRVALGNVPLSEL